MKARQRLLFLAASASNAGIQFYSSILYSIGQPLFQAQFKMPTFSVNLLFALVGPLAGIIVQPLVGTWSDRHKSRFGRRRPFVLVGSVVLAAGMLLVAFSNLIGLALGDERGGPTPQQHTWGIVFGASGLVIAAVAANGLQGPSRALLGDLAPPGQLVEANALITTAMMCSAVIAPLIGAQLFYTSEPYQWLFLIGALVVLLCGGITIVTAREKSSLDPPPLSPSPSSPASSAVYGSASSNKKAPPFFLVSVFTTLRTTPRLLWRVLAAFFFSWCAFSPFLVLDTLWFAQNIYGGVADGTPEQVIAYKEGVRMSLYNSASFSAVSLLFSLVLPFAIKALSVKVVWANTAVISCVCYGLFLIVESVVPAFAINAGIALNFCVFNSVPFALLPLYAEPNAVGLFVGVFNAASLLSQLVVNLISSGVLVLVGQNVAWTIGIGGAVFGFISVLFVLFLPSDDAEREALQAAGLYRARLEAGVAVTGTVTPSGSDFEEKYLLSSSEPETAYQHTDEEADIRKEVNDLK